MIRLTIATVAKNPGAFLQKTVDSVIPLASHSEIEYFIKDGGSVDGSINFLRNNAIYRNIRFVSSPDTGVYDGMNQAISLASGQYIFFLNSGDLINPNCDIEQILAVLAHTSAKVVYMQLINNRDKVLICYPKTISRFLLYRKNICHQSIIAHRESIVSVGGFNTGIRYSADRDLLVRISSHFGVKSFKGLPIPWVIYKDNGITSQSNARKLMHQEAREINRRYFSWGERFFFSFIEVITLKSMRVAVIEFLRGGRFYRIYRNAVNWLGF